MVNDGSNVRTGRSWDQGQESLRSDFSGTDIRKHNDRIESFKLRRKAHREVVQASLQDTSETAIVKGSGIEGAENTFNVWTKGH